MNTFGAAVTPPPSDTTAIDRKMLEENPASTGSLGTAISEAVEHALNVSGNKGRYQLGSVLNQVVLHQLVRSSAWKATPRSRRSARPRHRHRLRGRRI